MPRKYTDKQLAYNNPEVHSIAVNSIAYDREKRQSFYNNPESALMGIFTISNRKDTKLTCKYITTVNVTAEQLTQWTGGKIPKLWVTPLLSGLFCIVPSQQLDAHQFSAMTSRAFSVRE